MAENTPLCWEYDIPLDIISKVRGHNELIDEISMFRHKLKENNSPGKIPVEEECLKIQSKLKLFVFSKDAEDVSKFLVWNKFTSEECALHFNQESVMEAGIRAKDDNFLVIPVHLISHMDLDNNVYIENVGHGTSILFKPITVLTFRPRSKKEMQSIVDRLERTGLVSEDVFSEKDCMLRGFLSRKVQDWVVKQCDTLLSVFEKSSQDLEKVPSCAEFENRLSSSLQHTRWFDAYRKDFPIIIMDRDKKRQFRDRAVGELCKETFSESFKGASDFLLVYYQSYMNGMVACIVKTPCTSKELRPKRNSATWVDDFMSCILEQIKERQECIKQCFYDEIQNASNIRNFLQEHLIPRLQQIRKNSKVHDEVHYDVQIRLSRIIGVRSFGIEDKQFTVYVDPEWMGDESLLSRIKRAVHFHYEVDRSCLLEWKEPIFHYRTGDMIKGEGSRSGIITVFAERVDSDSETPRRVNTLYFITCEHVAPEKEMRVFFSKCSKCRNSFTCSCEREELGINMYPFGRQKENPFDAIVDITCGIVHNRTSIYCDKNVRGRHDKLIEIVAFSNTIDDHTGRTVIKWDSEENEQKGQYCGVQYMTPPDDESLADDNSVSVGTRRVDLIKSWEGTIFGKNGESGALIFLVQQEENNVDVISPAFVYLGQWAQTQNKSMCFRLQEGIECLEMEHKLKLRLCFENAENAHGATSIS
ncbi:uncharacterized protein LOC133178182 [Saccostrea echinata]|uniref:uncharacterized protein LOC133178182 n=1 Tax=Saccostrea echinata TaxID=191078 RepID=UPI002A7F35CD|nr:uncharacterized protein LOC133178182 [Saccostrea echinata]